MTHLAIRFHSTKFAENFIHYHFINFFHFPNDNHQNGLLSGETCYIIALANSSAISLELR